MAQIGELELCYETFGDAGDPPLLLVMGLGTQMIGWPDGFCAAARRPRLPRHPLRQPRHRALDPLPPVPRRRRCASSLRARQARRPHYTLADMADDGIGLLGRARDRARARRRRLDGRHDRPADGGPPPGPRALARLDHVQHRPPLEGPPGLRVYPLFMRRPAREPRRGDRVDAARRCAMIGSPGFPFEEDALRAVAQQSFERGHDPAGSARQLAAILTRATATPELRELDRADRRDPRHARPARHAVRRARDGRRRSPAPGSSRSTAWATTSRAARGTGSWTPWWRTRSARMRPRGTPPPRSLPRVDVAHPPRRRRGAGPTCARSGSSCTTTTRRSAARRSGRTSTTTPRGRRAARSTASSSPAAASPRWPSATAS